ncbi:hypothetical protein [uncultured Stenotrophomonas sp.]|uniref:hypothetical protein n=1 Tax=uncultured Stenotrophomonas sp. TaxID=165438 RepID=UPI0028EE1099|nr:hypothetical protein [uncultured Stenotrophomonas sp.]
MLRWLPRLFFIAAALLLLWAGPSWWIGNRMVMDMPVEVRPPAPWSTLIPLLMAAMPAVFAIVLITVGVCLARRRSYRLCMVASCVAVFCGPAFVLAIPTVILLTRTPVKALFERNV